MPHPHPWLPLNRDHSPTKASTDLFNALKAAGADVINLGQGRETAEFAVLRAQLAASHNALNSAYNVTPDDVFAAASLWLTRFLGIETQNSTSFAMQTLGREGLDESLRLIAKQWGYGANTAVLMPDTSWPMVPDLLQDYGLTSVPYNMQRGQYAANIAAALAANNNIAAVYLNSPHNPTGLRLTATDFAEIFAVLDAHNSSPAMRALGKKVTLILDNPYFHAASAGQSSLLDFGGEAFKLERITPWVSVQSFSKAWGTAQPGFTLLCCHPSLAKAFNTRLTRTVMLSYDKNFYGAILHCLQPAQDAACLSHFSDLRQKYVQNRAALEAAFGVNKPSPATCLDGDAGMTALLRLDSNQFFNRQVSGKDNKPMTLANTNDLIEWLANKAGVVTVNNGLDSEGNALLRLAAAAQPAQYAQAVQRLQNAFAEVQAAPKVSSTPANSPRSAGLG